MDCLEFRRRLGAEPRSDAADMRAHRARCPLCQAAWQRAQAFEDHLLQAMRVPLPENLIDRLLLTQNTAQRQRWRRRRPWLAAAASLVLALGAGGYAWHYQDMHSLPAMAVAHMPEEIASLDLTRPLSHSAVADGFAGQGVNLRGQVPFGTTYVHDCMVGPYRAVHLVTRRDHEPVVVLYLPRHPVKSMRQFQRQGWIGREQPLGQGSLVVLTNRGSARPFDAVAREWSQAIQGQRDPNLRNVNLVVPAKADTTGEPKAP